jgi:hypothetical protein
LAVGGYSIDKKFRALWYNNGHIAPSRDRAQPYYACL